MIWVKRRQLISVIRLAGAATAADWARNIDDENLSLEEVDPDMGVDSEHALMLVSSVMVRAWVYRFMDSAARMPAD